MERHNVGSARRIVEYGRRQSVEISVTGDPTTDLRYSRSRRIAAWVLWRGCIPAMNGRASVRNGLRQDAGELVGNLIEPEGQ